MPKSIDILFINPPSAFDAYAKTKVTVFKQVFPLLSFMCISAVLKKERIQTSLLDLGIENDPYNLLNKVVREQKPRYIGITSTTPLFFEVKEIARIVRQELGSQVKILYGGPHATALPKESLKDSEIDIVIRSEGEISAVNIFMDKNLSNIKGISYKQNEQIVSNDGQPYINDLDSLPFPDISLYNISRYHCSKLVSKESPVLHMETSRGCPSNCTFCNKNIYGRYFRKKSPHRVIEEMKYFIKNGAREFRIIDDQFATDIDRAKIICEMIIKEGIKIPWNLANGVRVDRVDEEFVRLAKRAGCYQIGIGFESGDQKCLDSIDKGITLEQSARCMAIMKKVGIETIGFFMIGLPEDTHETIKKTIKFAVKMMPTYAKTTITIPFPGTRLFEQYEKEGRINSYNWSIYNIHKVADIYDHPNLTQKELLKYYYKFYNAFYFNPRFLWMRFWKGIREGTFFRDIYYGLKTFFWNH